MGEVVYLDEYRLARAIVRARAEAHRWVGLRFMDLDYFDWFSIPNVCGGDDSIVCMKVEHDAAFFWGECLRNGPCALFSNAVPFRLAPDMPVLQFTDT